MAHVAPAGVPLWAFSAPLLFGVFGVATASPRRQRLWPSSWQRQSGLSRSSRRVPVAVAVGAVAGLAVLSPGAQSHTLATSTAGRLSRN